MSTKQAALEALERALSSREWKDAAALCIDHGDTLRAALSEPKAEVGEEVLARAVRDYNNHQNQHFCDFEAMRAALASVLPARDGEDAEIVRLRAENEQLLGLSSSLDEHPEDYQGPCMCKLCMSYAD